MKKLYNFILLFLVCLMPQKTWAVIPVSVDFDPYEIEGNINTAAIMGTSATTAAMTTYLSNLFFYEFSSGLGAGWAASGLPASNAAAAQINMHQGIANRAENKGNAEPLRRGARYFNMKPIEMYKKVRQAFAGDYEGISWDTLEEKFKTKLDEFMQQFTEAALEEKINTFVTDILSCQTPQLETMLPSFDLDFGFGFCDYKQMLSDMKAQTKSLSNQSWGNMVRINGQSVDKFLDDPDALSRAIHARSPTTGHAILFDAMSGMSMRASMQATVDTAAIGKKMQSIANKAEKGNYFSEYGTIDALGDLIKTQSYATLINSKNAEASRNAEQTKLDMEKAKAQLEARREIQQQYYNQQGATAGKK